MININITINKFKLYSMNKKRITVDIYQNKYINNKILNMNNDECLICYKKMNNNNKIILINNYCNCFITVLLCEKCFISWLIKINKCFVCRKILYDNNNKIKYYNILNRVLLIKVKEKLETVKVNIIMDTVEINRENQVEQNSLKILSNISIFIFICCSIFLMVYTIIPKVFNITIIK